MTIETLPDFKRKINRTKHYTKIFSMERELHLKLNNNDSKAVSLNTIKGNRLFTIHNAVLFLAGNQISILTGLSIH